MEVTDQEQELCVDLETDCIQENITVSDTVCVEGVEFNCQQDVNMEENVCEKIVKENCTNTPREVEGSILIYNHPLYSTSRLQ